MRIVLAIVLANAVGPWASATAAAQEHPGVAVTAAAIYSTQSSTTIPGGSEPGVPKPAISGSAQGFTVGAAATIT